MSKQTIHSSSHVLLRDNWIWKHTERNIHTNTQKSIYELVKFTKSKQKLAINKGNYQFSKAGMMSDAGAMLEQGSMILEEGTSNIQQRAILYVANQLTAKRQRWKYSKNATFQNFQRVSFHALKWPK